MNREELNKLKIEVYKLLAKNKGRKSEKTLKKILNLIEYTLELKYMIKNIREIGSKHSL